MALAERLGHALGTVLAPLAAGTAALRRARALHPEGIVLRAEVLAVAHEGPFADVAQRLEGPALVRLSSAWWRGREWPDVLGCAVRFRRSDTPDATPAPDDQDLLCATIRKPWTTPFAPLSTEQHDFLANDYYAVSPFEIEGAGRALLRLRSPRLGLPGLDREDRLATALELRVATLLLEARPKTGPRGGYRPLARVRLVERVEVDQSALRFSPFRAGRGLEPVGFIHALRAATYRSSQGARPAAAGAPRLQAVSAHT